jgi:hypothetical protein
MLGQETPFRKYTSFYFYDDGTLEKGIVTE